MQPLKSIDSSVNSRG